MARTHREEADEDPKAIGHYELVRMVLELRTQLNGCLPRSEFSTFKTMLLAGVTVAGGGIVTLLVMAINIRNGG